MREQYTYAVARIRALEVRLFSDYTVEKLIECPTYGECLRFLADCGWGSHEGEPDAEAILKTEEEKLRKIMEELVAQKDMHVFDVLNYPKLFHNLKAAVKDVCTKGRAKDVYYDDAAIPGEEMRAIVEGKKFGKLPSNMREAAADAYDAMLTLRDGQLCDVIIDKAALDAAYKAGMASNEQVARDYAEAAVAVADIKIAVRSAKTGKSAAFMERALAKCNSLNVDMLKSAALSGQKALAGFLAQTPYREAAQEMMKSPEAFECWCDNYLIETLKPQKYKAFTIGPVVAYAAARQNEIKTVRIILAGKQNGFSRAEIEERVRKMYV